MREIKFRCWNPDKKQMVYEGCDMLNVEPFIYMQYINYEDVNGKEMYDGDVVNVTQWNNKDLRLFKNMTLSYSNYTCSYNLYPRDEDCGRVNEPYGITEEDEYCVVGNIYENPELLK